MSLDQSPVSPFIGSNSWVWFKETKTESYFANDPHILISQPGTWYEARCYPDFELYGCYFSRDSVIGTTEIMRMV
jgi:penicillin amidase